MNVLSPNPLDIFAKCLGEDSPEVAMIKACTELLDRCHITNPPVPLVEIGKLLGLRKTCAASFYLNGPTTLRRGGAYEIWYPKSGHWRRDRFTIAHEIAHIIIMETLRDAKLIHQLQHPSIVDDVERLCNKGAAHLLMPDHFILKTLVEYGFSAKSLRWIYDKYLVSQEVMLIRITEVIPYSAMTLWKRMPRGQEFRVQKTWTQYRHKRFFGVPVGCSTKYVSPDIIRPSNEGRIYDNGLTLKHASPPFDGCIGIADQHFLKVSNDDLQQPTFKGFSVPDEDSFVDVFLLIVDYERIKQTNAWKVQLQHFLLD